VEKKLRKEAMGTPTFKIQSGKKEPVIDPKETFKSCSFQEKYRFLFVFT
jgi:hypothetical protein